METRILSVSDINNRIKNMLDSDTALTNVCIRGELSNYKIYPSGHHYFTVKDEASSLRCVMFKASASRLRFRPESGMKVILTGRVSIFLRDGVYQLYAETMLPDGLGDLHVAFEQLKEKLSKAGYFDAGNKKSIPEYPHRIAIITSEAGAAIRDMLRILVSRYPLTEVLVLPVRVQGDTAPAEIAGAIKYANRYEIADVIITGRGGGSIEDLWAFNDERVAIAIYESQIPVISAVGHEPDVTISDYVADLRAATPSNAAELIAPDIGELISHINDDSIRLRQSAINIVKTRRDALSAVAGSRAMTAPMSFIDDKRMLLEYNRQRLSGAAERIISEKKREYIRLSATLDALSPLKVLSRGYSIVKTESGAIVKSYRDVDKGDRIDVGLADGSLCCSVQKVTAE